MFGLGGSEIVVIVVVALLVFGPQKIPEIARAVSKAYKEWAKVRTQVDSTITDIKREINIKSGLEKELGLDLKQDSQSMARGSRGQEQPILPVPVEDDYLAGAGQAEGREPEGAANGPGGGS